MSSLLTGVPLGESGPMSKEAQFALSIATVRPTFPDVAIPTLG